MELYESESMCRYDLIYYVRQGVVGGGKVEMSNCPNGRPDLIASRAFVPNNDG